MIEITRILRESLRQGELIGRYGGDEFAIIVPGSTQETAKQIAERLLEKLNKHTVATRKVSISITSSLGIAELAQSRAKNLDELLELADEALYRAKHAGRNRFAAFDETPTHQE